ncbi:aspartate carbamoyltransferase [Paraburkholderia xenovorans]|uniref:aspartate carbamoyltransferase n=1 Tax=Paraburkholderia xenovorans TaxID=36873 RepID=UPI0038B9FB6D
MKAATLLTSATVIAGLNTPLLAFAADAERQSEVQQRGAEVMPFNLKATTHIFTKLDSGGSQRVIAKDPSDVVQTRLIRMHLREIQAEFRRGNFSVPARIHGSDMPGLSQLGAAKPGQISIAYRDVDGGGELILRSGDPGLVSALHVWFDAQLSDHGTDAMDGHMAHHPGMVPPGSE